MKDARRTKLPKEKTSAVVVPVARVIGYSEQAADFRDIRRGLKRLSHNDSESREVATKAEAALDRIEVAIANTLKAQAEATASADAK